MKIAIVLFSLMLAGCAGTVKVYDPATGELTSKTPAAVAVAEASAKAHDTCNVPGGIHMLEVADITKLSASAQAEYMRNLPMMVLLGQIQDKEDGCHSQIAKETQAYFVAQSSKYRQYGKLGSIGLIAGFSYLALDSWFDAIAGISAGGDQYVTNLGNRSVGDSSGGGSGSVSASGDSTLSDITINNGIANASGRAQANSNVDKAIGVPLDGDSNFDQVDNGSQGGIIIDDPDGGNSGSFF